MSKQPSEIEIEDDVQVRAALKHFRESVHAWGEEEFAKPRTLKPKRTLLAMRSPVLNWAAAAVLGVTAVSIPMIHHYQVERLKSFQEADMLKQRQLDVVAQTDVAINDEELLSHVDEDVAQDAPDAMEPLASLMTESSARR